MKAIWVLITLPGLVMSAGMVKVPIKRDGGHRLVKRFNGQATFFNVEENEVACGGFYKSSEAVVALNQAQFGDLNSRSQYCNRMITITYNGKSHTAKIVDACPRSSTTCAFGALDMSTSLFNFFENPDKGVFDMQWTFGTGGGGGESEQPATTTQRPTSTYSPPPTSTYRPPTSTTPPPSSSSFSSSSASSSSISSSVSLNSTSVAPARSTQSTQAQINNLASNGQIVIAFGRILALSAQD